MYDLLVFIGRFQPFHREHKRVIDVALTKAKNVLVLIGSSEAARTPKNPFTYDERTDMIFNSYGGDAPLITDALVDYPYDNDKWAEQVRKLIKETALGIANDWGTNLLHGTNDMKIGLIGAKKDDSTFYLDMFPEFPLEEVEMEHFIHATNIRQYFFRYGVDPSVQAPYATYLALVDFAKTAEYKNLCDWQYEIDEDAHAWKDAPYPVKKLTADAVVRYKDNVLLVKRAKNPGKGLWAVPGGYVNNERMETAALRELREETVINLTDKGLMHRIKGRQLFDDPDRSTMGHVVTHAIYIDLSDLPEQPEVVGADDAAEAVWTPITSLKRDMFFDDHYHMIQHFIEGNNG